MKTVNRMTSTTKITDEQKREFVRAWSATLRTMKANAVDIASAPEDVRESFLFLHQHATQFSYDLKQKAKKEKKEHDNQPK
jgi:hypothetical protein